MKKLYLLLILYLGMIGIVNAQKHFPIVSEHPFWTEKHGQLYGCSCSGCSNYYCSCTMPVYYKTDTIINSVMYNRLYTYSLCMAQYTGGPPPMGCLYQCSVQYPEILFATIRHDTANCIVYIWDGSQEKKLYDYNSIVVGQPYPNMYNNPSYPNLKVLAKDSLLLNGSYYTTWILGVNNGGVISDSNFAQVIEGIGTSFGIKANLVPVFENDESLQCFSIHNVNIYPNTWYNCDTALQINEHQFSPVVSVVPNPATDFIKITADKFDLKSKAEVIDIAGRVIMDFNITGLPYSLNIGNLKKGIYFLKISSAEQSSYARFVKM